MTHIYDKDGKHWNNFFKMHCHHCKEERHMNDLKRVVIYEVSKASSEYYGEEIGNYDIHEVCNDCIKDYLKKNPEAELAPEDHFDRWIIKNNPKPSFSKVAILRKINDYLIFMNSCSFTGNYGDALKYEGKAESLINLLEESFLPEAKTGLPLKERFNNLTESLLNTVNER